MALKVLLQLCLVWIATSTSRSGTPAWFVQAGEDANVYQFGSNPNAKYNKMYFADAAAVLRNLDSFHSLSIRVHGCAWSSNRAVFDDDGENFDGVDQWYEGRTAGSSANVAFSLYGTLYDRMHLIGGCRRGTYINSFFTNNGVDSLVEALGLDGKIDSSYSYCHQYDYDQGNDGDEQNNNNKNNKNQNNKQGQNGDDDATALPQSATLGCSLDGKFTTALFTDQYCQGTYFWNTTNDGLFDDYNTQLEESLHCHKIWHGGSNKKDQAIYTSSSASYDSLAHAVLQQSDVCDTHVNPLCPNPWDKKSRYEHNFAVAGATRTMALDYHLRRPLILVAHALLVLAALLLLVAYRARNKERLQAQGWCACLQQDLFKYGRRQLRRARKTILGSSSSGGGDGTHTGRKKSRKSRSRARQTSRDESEDNHHHRTGEEDDEEGEGGEQGDYVGYDHEEHERRVSRSRSKRGRNSRGNPNEPTVRNSSVEMT